MSADKEKLKPKTDIELFLNLKNLKNDSGAGANAAASRVDLKFPPTDPLSEIVWSPDKGLSLKCADSSFVDKNSSLFRHVQQSCSGGKSATDKPIDDVFVKPIAMSCTKSDAAAAAAKDAPTVHSLSGSDAELECKTYEEINIGSGDNNEDKMNTAERPPNLPDDQDGDPKKDWEENTGDQTNIGTDNKLSAISDQIEQRPSPGIPSNEGIDAGTGKKAVVTDDDLHTVVQPIIEYKCSGAPGTNVASSSRSPFVKMESSAENDLRTVDCEAADIVNEIKDKSQDNEMMSPCEKVLPVLDSPCNSRIRMTKNKGKEKSLSDVDANVRLSMDNDSHSSVESCNSTGFFSTGMKKHKFQQQLIIGSKRVKKSSEETSGSKSYIEQDSSFKNWISSMVKGLSQSTRANSNTLALTFANPDHDDVRSNEKLITCKMNQDPEPKNTGFKSIFQSMYCPNLKNVETKMFHQGEGNEDLEPSNMVHGIDATPITCYAVNSSLSERYLQSNKNEASIGGYDTGPLQPNIRPLNFFNSHESSKNNPVENENCSILDLSKDKEEMASHSSSTRKNTNNTENVDSGAPSEKKEAENICHKRDTLGSLWITRFSPKSTAALTISDHLNERDGSKIPDSDKHVYYLNNCKIEETGQQPANETEAFTGLKEDEGNNDHKSKYMLSNFSSSAGFTNSEQMASTFARRFGAIKHIIPTNKTDSTSHEFEVKTLVDDCIPSQKHFIQSNEVSARPHTDQADRMLSGGADHQADQNINLKRKSNENITFKTECKSSYKKHCGSSSKENKFKETPVSSPSRLAERKISHVPEGIFDAVKRLQLSRNDILKWINAHGSISQLDGFFLRLRLGKWEEGLGGTGYHVACIHETGRHSSEQNTRKSLSVKIGGIKCMVESQYISNQSFLEEEIMEWWSSTSEANDEVPSEEDLIAKSKRKQMLSL